MDDPVALNKWPRTDAAEHHLTKVYKFRVQCMLERTTLDRLQITQEAESVQLDS